MSLIHEALERAREEAARREARARGDLPAERPAPPHYDFSRSRALPVVAAALLVGLAGFGLARWLERPSAPGPGQSAGPTAAPAPVASAPSPAPSPPEATDSAAPAAPLAAPAAPDVTPPAQPAEQPGGAARPERRPRPAPPAEPPVEATAALELQGIVWSSEQPTAVINGLVLAQGETVGELEVLRIEPRSVVLGDGERTIELVLGARPAPPEEP
jgi:hypothetical protein